MVFGDGNIIYNTEEFNGDMGPTMCNGELFGGIFARDVKTVDDFEKFARMVVDRFDYGDDYKDGASCLGKDEVSSGSEDSPFCLSSAWDTTFNLSDYGYVKNLSSHDVWIEDKNGTAMCLSPGDFDVYDYGRVCDGDDVKAVRIMRGELKPWD